MRIALGKSIPIFFIATLGFAGLATATPVTWRVVGHVSQIVGDIGAIADVGGSANLGDLFTITYTFDSALATVSSGPDSLTEALWGGVILNTRFQIGDWQYQITSQSDSRFSPPVWNNVIGLWANDVHVGDEYLASMEDWLGPSTNPTQSRVVAGWFAQTLSGSGFVNSTDILASPPDLTAFTFINGPQMSIDLLNIEGQNAHIIANVERIAPVRSVPEPSCLSLLGLGLIGMRVLRRANA